MQKSIKNRAKTYLLIIIMISSLLLSAVVSATGSETRVILCTSQGFKSVIVKVEQEIQLSETANSGDHCVYCLTSESDHDLNAPENKFLALVSEQHFSAVYPNTLYNPYYLSLIHI